MRESQADPWAMYMVLSSRLTVTRGEATAAAGAAAIRCRDTFATDPRWRAAFEAWDTQSFRKVALRADAAQFGLVYSRLDWASAPIPGDGSLVLCLPPRLRSDSEPELAALAPFTDPKRPSRLAEHPIATPAMTLLIPADLKMTAGKAMAQAGHATIMAAAEWSDVQKQLFAAWRAAGCACTVRLSDQDTWDDIKRDIDCVVVRDAGLTQIQAGTETVIALPPGFSNPALEALPLA